MNTVIRWGRGVLAGLVELWRTTDELHHRRAILNRPWLHDHLHWAPGDEGEDLHGTTIPLRAGDAPVTAAGWCPCHLTGVPHGPGDHEDSLLTPPAPR